MFWRDMGVVNLPSGQPTMKLTGGAAGRLGASAAARDRGVHSPDAHRRGAIRAGVSWSLRPAPALLLHESDARPA